MTNSCLFTFLFSFYTIISPFFWIFSMFTLFRPTPTLSLKWNQTSCGAFDFLACMVKTHFSVHLLLNPGSLHPSCYSIIYVFFQLAHTTLFFTYFSEILLVTNISKIWLISMVPQLQKLIYHKTYISWNCCLVCCNNSLFPKTKISFSPTLQNLWKHQKSPSKISFILIKLK